MTVEIVVPALGESIAEAIVAKWFKSVGDTVKADEPLVELETDKVTVEVPAPVAGVLAGIVAETGSTVAVGAVLGAIEGQGTAGAPADKREGVSAASSLPENTALPEAAPSARKLMEEHFIDPATVPGTGRNGRITKADVIAYLERPVPPAPVPAVPAAVSVPVSPSAPREERVRMSSLRKRIAERLKEAQNTAAMLTTFNEVDMTALNMLRDQYRESFEKKHGARLGFMSFFVKACVVALKEWPAVNAEISGDELIYKNHYDIGVAVGTPDGLVVPVVRDADRLTFAEVETAIADFGRKAREGRLTIEEMSGGTFTISNGGIYGSLMSTPILNPPQSGILGMHKTMMRPVVMPDGVIAARPMMYLALSYDHRVIDGREAVSFLVRVKECIEDPHRILLDM